MRGAFIMVMVIWVMYEYLHFWIYHSIWPKTVHDFLVIALPLFYETSPRSLYVYQCFCVRIMKVSMVLYAFYNFPQFDKSRSSCLWIIRPSSLFSAKPTWYSINLSHGNIAGSSRRSPVLGTPLCLDRFQNIEQVLRMVQLWGPKIGKFSVKMKIRARTRPTKPCNGRKYLSHSW